MTYISLALSIIRLISQLLERWQRNTWMNEGARKVLAQQVKETNDALAKALQVEKEVDALNAEQLLKVAEDNQWLRD
jgi:hypothetical protein